MISNDMPSSRDQLHHATVGVLYYFLTSLIVVAAVILGHDLWLFAHVTKPKETSTLDAFAVWDGRYYAEIATLGYTLEPGNPSTVVFFPAYPVLARGLVHVTGLDPVLALVLLSHLFLSATFVLTAAYVARRFPMAPPSLSEYVLLSMGLLPMTCFFRLAYTESLFLLLTVLALYGMERAWPSLLIAAIVGLATATRPVGVALLVPFVLYVWQHSAAPRDRLAKFAVFLPVACWGILAFTVFQWLAFGNPWAFVENQQSWSLREVSSPASKWTALVTVEPVWSVFDYRSTAYWASDVRILGGPWFSWNVTNSLFFVLGVAVLGIGLHRKMLSSYEIAFAIPAVAIPYVLQSYEMYMMEQGRYMSVVFPIYLVVGQLLVRLPGPLAAGFLAVSAFFLGLEAIAFTVGPLGF